MWPSWATAVAGTVGEKILAVASAVAVLLAGSAGVVGGAAPEDDIANMHDTEWCLVNVGRTTGATSMVDEFLVTAQKYRRACAQRDAARWILPATFYGPVLASVAVTQPEDFSWSMVAATLILAVLACLCSARFATYVLGSRRRPRMRPGGV
jgi:hypothetical protein